MVTVQEIQTALQVFLSEKRYERLHLRAMLFDMDGVLFDSMKNHTLAWYKTICEIGISCERDEFYLHEGRTGKGTINLLFRRAFNRDATEEEVKRIYAEKSRYFNELPEAQPMPGARELLEKVVTLGIKPVLVTGSGQLSLLERLNRIYPHVFQQECMITAFDVRQGKPHPEPYLKGLEKAGVRPSEAIVIENAPMGVMSGVAAGVFTVAVNTGPIPEKELRKAGANLLFSDMPTLVQQFDAIAGLCKVGV